MTFSIIARDPATGAIGVATATGLIAVGGQVPHCRRDAGAIATQGFSTSILHAEDGMELLRRGWDAPAMVDAVIARDEGRGWRQLLAMDRNGVTAGWTGEANRPHAGHVLDRDLALAGNFLDGPEVLERMREAYLNAGDEPLAARLLAALAAGERGGGDVRGNVSAALLVDEGEPIRLDLRVDDSRAPVAALEALLVRARAPEYRAFATRLPSRADPHRH